MFSIGLDRAIDQYQTKKPSNNQCSDPTPMHIEACSSRGAAPPGFAASSLISLLRSCFVARKQRRRGQRGSEVARPFRRRVVAARIAPWAPLQHTAPCLPLDRGGLLSTVHRADGRPLPGCCRVINAANNRRNSSLVALRDELAMFWPTTTNKAARAASRPSPFSTDGLDAGRMEGGRQGLPVTRVRQYGRPCGGQTRR